jgi:UDP-N-acetylglucosamine 2-epimerase (non-hydrolysing)
MPTVAVVIGTRPEAIKMGPVIRALERRPALETVVISTGQHRQMLDQVLQPFDIAVDLELSLMEPGQTLYRLSAKAIAAFEGALERLRPSLLLVQGDTTTAFLGALAAFYRQIPVGHVEAGLRTGNKYSPFPEEMNRRLITTLADLHFAATAENRRVLLAEGVAPERVFVTGNTVVDMLSLSLALPPPPALPLTPGKRLVLVTAHRRESFGAPMAEMFAGLREIASSYPDIEMVYPVHLNPKVQNPAREQLGDLANVRLIEPLDYFSFVHLMARAALILSDSGGVQEEAPSLGVPVLVLRNETERIEAVATGAVKLVGTSRANIVAEARRVLDGREPWPRAPNPYGDGRAAERIAAEVLRHFGIAET